MLLLDIRRVLRTNQSIIVHFSGTPRGIGAGHFRPDFPADLQQVAHNPHWEVPCSTVTAGQTRSGGHLTGSVGLILRCRKGASLRGVCHTDAGSSYDPLTGVRHLGTCVAPSAINCQASITNRVGHNEWIVQNFRVAGLFMDGNLDVWDTPTAFQRPTDFIEIGTAFPGLSVVCFHEGSLWEVHPRVQQRKLSEFI